MWAFCAPLLAPGARSLPCPSPGRSTCFRVRSDSPSPRSGFFAAGLWAIEQELLDSGEEDPAEIVVDEVIGQWIALLPVSVGAASAGVPFGALWPGILTAFVAFRLFDIWKPWLIGRVEARGDALGVMLDDALAGVAAALTVILFAGIAHGAFA